jgi:small subunit ribosomal protein S16
VICSGHIAKIDYKRLTKETIMAVKLRMTRIGRRHRPFFRINAVESRTPRDGRVLEKLGHYDPIEKDQSKQVVLDLERVKYWLNKGAIPSDTVSQILLRRGIKHKYAEEKTARRARARAIAHTKGTPFTKADRIAAEKLAEAAEEKAKAEEKTKAEAKPEVKEEAKLEAVEEKAQTEAETKAEAVEEKAKAQAETKVEGQTKVEAETKAEVVEEKPEPEVQTTVKAETQAVADTEAEEKDKAEAEAEPQAKEEQKPKKKKKPVRVKKKDKSDEN